MTVVVVALCALLVGATVWGIIGATSVYRIANRIHDDERKP